jgi:hypothetical protein
MKSFVTMLEETEDGTIKERTRKIGDNHFAPPLAVGWMGFEYAELKSGGFSFDFFLRW